MFAEADREVSRSTQLATEAAVSFLEKMNSQIKQFLSGGSEDIPAWFIKDLVAARKKPCPNGLPKDQEIEISGIKHKVSVIQKAQLFMRVFPRESSGRINKRSAVMA